MKYSREKENKVLVSWKAHGNCVWNTFQNTVSVQACDLESQWESEGINIRSSFDL